jgi:hypothetical protein
MDGVGISSSGYCVLCHCQERERASLSSGCQIVMRWQAMIIRLLRAFAIVGIAERFLFQAVARLAEIVESVRKWPLGWAVHTRSRLLAPVAQANARWTTSW